MDISPDISSILSDFIHGKTAADECFCLILSLLGYDCVKRNFLAKIARLRVSHPTHHTQLANVYDGYFATVDPQNDLPDELDCAVENGFYANDSEQQDVNYDRDLELALRLSEQTLLSEQTITQSQDAVLGGHMAGNNKITFASKLKENICEYHNDISASKDRLKEDVQKYEEETKNDYKVSESLQIQIQPLEGQKKKKKKKKNNVGRPLSNPPVILWFRRDLRLYDNPAVVAAAESGAAVIPVFLWSDKEEGPTSALATGGATKYWLHMALPALSRDMVEKYNNPIVYRKSSNYLEDILAIIAETGAKTLIVNDVYEPYLKARDDKIFSKMKSRGVKCERYHSYLLHEPGSIRTESLCMRGIGSVTHFMECCRQSASEPIGFPVEPPSCLPAGFTRPWSATLEELGLGRLPKRKDGSVIDWARIIRESWNFSENGAWEALQLFLSEGVRRYEKESSRGDQLNTCRISPYLHFGQISPRTVLNEGRHMKSPKFLRKLAWRDLSYWLLSIFPDLPSEPTRPQYMYQRWSQNKAHLKAWQKGNTGFPLVDAAMRQLWLTGWMNNYMRHVVASFLISYLHISWVEGYLWFQDTLLDADVAINAMMWQNGGMSGLDQWNFVMHPVDAAMTCDPKGEYVRKWVPELSRMPEEFIHIPWKCAPSILKRAGVQLGVSYPNRIITDLESAREQSLTDVVEVRMKFEELIDPRTGNDLVRLPNGVFIPCITRREFKYKTRNPDSRENPHNAVLKGYRSRKRDELVEFMNQRDFMASTMNECSSRYERGQKTAGYSFY